MKEYTQPEVMAAMAWRMVDAVADALAPLSRDGSPVGEYLGCQEGR